MKKAILIIAAVAFYINMHAQEFKKPLEKTFIAFDTTMNAQVKAEQSNKLALIAKKWSDSWSAHYYNAYSKAVLSYFEKEEAKRDAYLDEADAELEQAVTLLGKNNDETYVLAAMLANARMAVNPKARYQKYGKLYEDNLKAAKELNPNNPRMYYLQGTSKFYTPKMWGGGKKVALPYFEKAKELFAKQQEGDITIPTWGKMQNEYYITQCNSTDKE